MAVDLIFAGLGLIILAGFLGEFVFSKTRIPDVLWLILLGILIGPILGLISPSSIQDAASIFTTFALLFILFEGGLHIRIKDLMKSMYGATVLTISNFLLTVFVVVFIAKLFGFGWLDSALLGTILGGTSSAVVVPLVKRLNMGKENSLVLILESAFSDVLVIVASLTVIQLLKINTVDFGVVLQSLFGSFAIAILIGGVAGLGWILLLERFEALSKSYMSTIGLLLIIFGITEFAKSSGALAGLAFGIVLGNSRKILSLTEGEDVDTLSSSARVFFSQISFFVKTFFFVYIGILVSLTDLKLIALGLVLAAAAFLIRPIPVKLAYKDGGAENDKPIMESMVPKGLAAAVLAQIAVGEGLPNAEMLQTPVFSAIFFTIALTTALIFLVEHKGFRGTSDFVMKHFISKKRGWKKSKNSKEKIMEEFESNAAKATTKTKKPEKKKAIAKKKSKKQQNKQPAEPKQMK